MLLEEPGVFIFLHDHSLQRDKCGVAWAD